MWDVLLYDLIQIWNHSTACDSSSTACDSSIVILYVVRYKNSGVWFKRRVSGEERIISRSGYRSYA